MKICLIVPCDLSKESGGKTHALEIAKNWSKSGHTVFLFSRGLKKGDIPIVNVHYKKIPFVPMKHDVAELTFSIFLLFEILIYNFLLKFDVIYQRSSIFDFNLLFKKLIRQPIILELNDVPFSEAIKEELLKEVGYLKRIILNCTLSISKFIENIVFNNCSKIVATTKKIKHIEKYSDIQNKLRFIPFGANINDFKPIDKTVCRKLLNLSNDDKIICFVGSFLPWQGLEYLIKSMPNIIENISDTKLILMGDSDMNNLGNPKDELINLSHKLNLYDKIIFTGRVPYEKVPIYINASDICIVAQRPMREGFTPLKLFEYMACGKPVVASDIEGVREIVKESGGGILVPPENPEKLAESVIKILKDENLSSKLGENGFRCVTEKYSWERVARDAMKVCEDAIKTINK